MDSSWLEILPLPKSRPGWMATIFIAIIGASVLWIVQPSLYYYFQENHYTKEYDGHLGFPFIELTYPNHIDTAQQYNIEIRISNNNEQPLSIDTIEIIQSNTGSGGGRDLSQRTVNKLNVTLRPNESYTYKIPLSAPEFAENESKLAIIVEVYERGLHSSGDPFLISPQLRGITVLDRWLGLRIIVLSRILTMSGCLLIVAFLAVISVWLTEYKVHQDVWLSTKEGWDIVRVLFFRASRTFVLFIFLLIMLFGFPKLLSYIGIFITCLLFMGWLFMPELTSYWSQIYNWRSRRKNNQREVTHHKEEIFLPEVRKTQTKGTIRKRKKV